MILLRAVIFNILLFTIFARKVLTLGQHPGIETTFIGLQNENNLGHSGYVYLSTDKKIPEFQLSSCDNINVNETTCSYLSTITKYQSNSLVIRGWAASTLRDNIMAFLSYLLHQTTNIFVENIDDSLNIINEQVRKNNIKIMDLLPQMLSIAKFDKSSQFAALFKLLQKVMPAFCHSELDELTKFFTKLTDLQREHLFVMMKARKYSHEIDLFADISYEILPALKYKIPSYQIDKKIQLSLGREFAILFSSIKDGKIALTQPVLAVLMLNMKFSELSPDDNEDLRFIIDVLRFNKIYNWSPGFTTSANIKCPWQLVKRMMKTIRDLIKVDPIVKDIANRLQDRLRKPIRSNVVKVMDKFFSIEQLNVPLLIEILQMIVNITEVNELKNFIENGTVSLAYALKGFNRYFYDTPDKLVIAFMRRIQIRTPAVSNFKNIINVIVDQLKKRNFMAEIYSYNRNNYDIAATHEDYDHIDNDNDLRIIRYKRNIHYSAVEKFGNNMFGSENAKKTIFRRSLDDIINSKGSLNISNATIQSDCPEITPKRSLDVWLDDINNSATAVSPITLIADASGILAEFMMDPEINNLVKNIVNKIIAENTKSNNTKDDETLIIITRSLQNIKNTHSNLHAISKASKSIINNNNNPELNIDKIKISRLFDVIFNGTKRDLLKAMLKKMLDIKKVRARRLVYFEVIRIYCILVNGKLAGNYTSSIFNLDNFPLDDTPNNATYEKLLKSITSAFRKSIVEFNVKGTLLAIKSKNYRTNRLLLMKMFKLLLLHNVVKKHEMLFNEVVLFLYSIYDFTTKFPELVKSSGLKTPNETYEAQLVLQFLHKPGLLQLLGPDFDIALYTTKGLMLKAILESLIISPLVIRNTTLFNAIQHYIPKITCRDKEAEPVTDILIDVLSDQVDVSTVIEYGLNEDKLLPDVQDAFTNMWSWYGGSFDPIAFMKQLNVSLYDTRAEFIEGFLDVLEATVDSDFMTVKSDIRLMKSAILKTNSGREPVDYM